MEKTGLFRIETNYRIITPELSYGLGEEKINSVRTFEKVNSKHMSKRSYAQ